MTGPPWSVAARVSRVDAVLTGVLYLAVIGLWEFAARSGMIASNYVPAATQILAALSDLAQQGDFWGDVTQTLQLWAAALIFATVIGGSLGVLMGWSSTAHAALNMLIECLRPVPTVALIPVVVLLYGTNHRSAVILATVAAMWPILIQTIYGMRSTDPLMLDMARMFQLSWGARLRVVMLPSAARSIVSGIHVASGISLILVVMTGIIVGTPGIGDSITRAANGGAYAESYALLFTAGVLGLLANVGLGKFLNRAMTWMPRNAQEAR